MTARTLLRLVAASLLLATAARATDAPPPASIGAPAPEFLLHDQDGKPVDLGAFRGKVVVLEWTNPDCPFVRRHYGAKTMQSTAERFRDRSIVWLGVNTTYTSTPEQNREWRAAQQIPWPILDDHDGAVGRRYGAKTTPHLFVIDARGTLVYAGAIDDDPAGERHDAHNYVADALDDVTAGRPVRTAETRPYGCSVKYRP